MRPLRFALLTLSLLLAVTITACEQNPAPLPTPSVPPPSAPAASRPTIGQWHQLVYHQRLGTTILVNGGPETGQAPDHPLELWSWDGSSWRPLTPAGPAGPDTPRWRNFASVAYDSDRGVLVVHGGLQGRAAPLPETWEWNGQTWRQFSAAGPGGREGAGMTYDRARKVTLLFGGGNQDQTAVLGDTWAWDGARWRPLTEEGPSERFPGLMQFDQAHNTVVLYGGHVIVDSGPPAVSDTWVWNGQRWRQAAADSPPGPRVNTGSVFHERLGRVLMIGGGDVSTTLDHVWAWDGTTWTQLAANGMPHRQAHGLAYDPRRDRVILTGGLDQPGSLNRYQDVWEWDGATFTRVGPS